MPNISDFTNADNGNRNDTSPRIADRTITRNTNTPKAYSFQKACPSPGHRRFRRNAKASEFLFTKI